MPRPGPMACQVYSRYFARFGEWGQLNLILQGDPIPRDLEENAKRLRRLYLTEVERQEFGERVREQLSPRKKSTVTWVNDAGETCSVEGYLEER
jgi:hypothetical protein